MGEGRQQSKRKRKRGRKEEREDETEKRKGKALYEKVERGEQQNNGTEFGLSQRINYKTIFYRFSERPQGQLWGHNKM